MFWWSIHQCSRGRILGIFVVGSWLTHRGPMGQSQGDSEGGSHLSAFSEHRKDHLASPQACYLAMQIALPRVGKDLYNVRYFCLSESRLVAREASHVVTPRSALDLALFPDASRPLVSSPRAWYLALRVVSSKVERDLALFL
jgi:hypothetical protein